jgi:tetratricopeptide (TPR) repeat protein
MEENASQPEEIVDETLCVNCHQNKFEEGHHVNLCSSCRTAFIKYPIPKSIRWFALGLAVVILISLVRTQLYVAAAIHLGRAENAMEKRLFSTAEDELKIVLKQFPNDLNANGNMIIACAYNLDHVTAGQAYQKIANKSIEDQAFFQQIDEAMKYISREYPQDTLALKRVTGSATDRDKLLSVYQEMEAKPADSLNMAVYVAIANALYDLKDFTSAENVLQKVMDKSPATYSSLALMSAVKRNIGKYEEGLRFCDRMLEMNRENIYAISHKARIELKRKNDSAASKYADQAMKLNPENDSALEARAMVDFFSGKKKESLTALAIIKRHESSSGDSTISKRLLPIINGSEIYR